MIFDERPRRTVATPPDAEGPTTRIPVHQRPRPSRPRTVDPPTVVMPVATASVHVVRRRQDGHARLRGAVHSARPTGGLGRALLTTAAAAVLPGSGHLLLRRRRPGILILSTFVLLAVGGTVLALREGRSGLLGLALDTRVLLGVEIGCGILAVGWMAVVVRTYVLARPRRIGGGRRILGVAVVALLCLAVAAPFGFAADLAQSERSVVNTLFPTGGGTAGADVALPAHINVLLFGSDAGTDRTGTRSDSMMVASVDTTTSRAVLFGLPRNLEHAPFPPGSPMAARFPDGFFDPKDPLSGEYLLNAEYTYAITHPGVAPAGPTPDPGLNLLMSSIGTMLGIPLDYYVKIDMAGFSSIIDAVGGVTIDVGPVPLPIGGVLPDGTHVAPSGYVPAGVQHLDGDQALWYARSRRDSDDYNRMSRQRCMIQTLLKQKSAADLLAHFQAVAAATADSVATNIPQSFLPSLASLAGNGQSLELDSVAFDPTLHDPLQRDGKFDPSHPDYGFVRQVVATTIAGMSAPAPGPPAGASTPAPAAGTAAPATAAPQAAPLTDSCTSPSP